jgi:hypothetical protein
MNAASVAQVGMRYESSSEQKRYGTSVLPEVASCDTGTYERSWSAASATSAGGGASIGSRAPPASAVQRKKATLAVLPVAKMTSLERASTLLSETACVLTSTDSSSASHPTTYQPITFIPHGT